MASDEVRGFFKWLKGAKMHCLGCYFKYLLKIIICVGVRYHESNSTF